MNDFKRRFADLNLQQRALLEQRLVQRHSNKLPFSVNRSSQPRPLTHAQESLWFLDQLVPQSPLYNIPQAFRISGTLDPEALEKSFAATLARHEALRTKFVLINQKPMAVVQPGEDFHLQTIDLRQLNPETQGTEVALILNEQAWKPFNLSKDLMMRATLIRLSEDTSILVIVLHHIVSDNGSLGILYEELAAGYDAFVAGSKPQLSEIKMQFPDLAAFIRGSVEGQRNGPDLEYWKNRLAGKLPVLEMPTDLPRPAQKTYNGLRQAFRISSPVSNALSELSQRQGTSLYMTLLAAFGVLLSRYSQQDDILIGAPIGTRDFPEAERLIGFFVNTLVVRIDFSGDPKFQELLQRVRSEALGTYAHHKVPFELLIEEMRLPREPGRHPLYDVVFQLLPESSALLHLRGIKAEALPMESGTAKFDLTVSLTETTQGLTGDIEFNTDLFFPATIERLIGHFQKLLQSIVSHPEANISQLPILTTEEEHQLLAEWNQTRTDYPRQALVHELFQDEVEATPEYTALVFEGQSMSYKELNRRANQLARALQKIGVQPNTFVGVCLERSFDLIVAFLAVLKTGGAYVPFDPTYPRERLSYMYRDTGLKVLVTSAKLKSLLPSGAELFCIDESAQALATEDDGNLGPCSICSDDPAYLMYTSGSSGPPKGVVVPHRGIVRLVKNTHYARFDRENVFLQFAPASFDAATLEIWGALLHGAKLVLFPAQFKSLQQLEGILIDQRITTLWLTAGLFHQVVDHHFAGLKNVRQLLAGGDVLSVPHVLKVVREIPTCEVINGYGPTENTTFTCCYRVPADWPGGRSVPIGKPISNTTVFILDQNLRPVPIGVPGELYIGGDGLALEYLNSEELTREKFIPHPFEPRGKVYRTGDLARFLPDGNIEFLGRIDSQVKIRGFRVEPAEVQSAIVASGLVRECAVIARRDSSGSNFLAAFLVFQKRDGESIAALRDFLSGRLPKYMVPSQFIPMEQLPVTPNGKLDRAALPELDNTGEDLNEKTAPSSPAESKIAEIWKEVLQLQSLGRDDDFFEIGGHSLLAMRIISRINESFQTDLSLTALFEFSTVAGLAERVSREPSGTLSKIQPRGSSKEANAAGRGVLRSVANAEPGVETCL